MSTIADYIYPITRCIMIWLLRIPLLPFYIPLRLLVGGAGIKFYNHTVSFTPNPQSHCGYCHVPLEESTDWHHAYKGEHQWWCVLRKAGRSEFIEWR